MNILYIEDNLQSTERVQHILSQTPYTVCTTIDARDGFKLIPEIKPVAILLDLDLPDISGIQALTIFRNTPSLDNIPIIAVYDYDDDSIRQEFFDQGGDGFLKKPIDSQSLLTILASVTKYATKHTA